MSAPLISRAVNRVLQAIALNPERYFFQRELSRITGERYNGVLQALDRLVKEGVVETARVGDKPAFRANTGNPYLPEFQRIAIRSLGIPETLDDAGIVASKVIIHGSFAKGTATQGSDLDVLIVGREPRLGAAESALSGIAKFIGREISVKVYGHARYQKDLTDGASFIAAVANGQTINLRGTL